MRSATATVLAASALLVIAGCGRGARELSVAARLADEKATETLVEGRLDEAPVVVSWRFVTEADAAGWSVPGGSVKKSDDGIVASRASGGIVIAAPQELDPAVCDTVQVLTKSPAGPAELQWGEDDASGGKVRLEAPEAQGSFATYAFRLAPHPRWEGAPRPVRMVFPQAQAVVLTAVYALDETMRPERARAMGERTFLASLGGARLPARIGIGERPITKEIELPEGGLLRFACGLTPGVKAQVRFQVFVSSASIFESTITKAGSWHRAEVAIPPAPGKRVITLAVAADERFDPACGFALWGDPEILAPTQ